MAAKKKPILAANKKTGEVVRWDAERSFWKPIVAKNKKSGQLARYTTKGWEVLKTGDEQMSFGQKIATSDIVKPLVSNVSDAMEFVNATGLGVGGPVGLMVSAAKHRAETLPDPKQWGQEQLDAMKAETEGGGPVQDFWERSFGFAGRNLATGNRLAAAALYHDLANSGMLLEAIAEKLSQETGMDKGTTFAETEKYFRDLAKETVPKNIDEGTMAAVYQGLGAAPITVAKYALASRYLGSVIGMASVDALSAADRGPEEAAKAGLHGALFGKVLDQSQVLSRGIGTIAIGATAFADASASGASDQDKIANTVVMSILRSIGHSGPVTAKQITEQAKNSKIVRRMKFGTKDKKVERVAYPAGKWQDDAPATGAELVPVEELSRFRSKEELDQNKVEKIKESVQARGLDSPILIGGIDAGKAFIEDGNYKLQALKELGVTHAPTAIVKSATKSERGAPADRVLLPLSEDGTPTGRKTRSSVFFSPSEVDGLGINRERVRTAGGAKRVLPEHFTANKETAMAALQQGDYYVLSAENPGNKTLPDEVNAERTKALIQELQDEGYKPIPVKGMYYGPENSLIVPDLPLDRAMQLGRKFEQESIAGREGLIYQDGTVEKAASLALENPKADNLYTDVKLDDGSMLRFQIPLSEEKAKIDLTAEQKGAVQRAVNSMVPSRVASKAGDNYRGRMIERIEATPGAPESLVRREDILKPLLKALGMTIYSGRVKGPGVLGFYVPKKETLRTKFWADVQTVAHEIAHLIDDRVWNGFRSYKNRPSERPWIKGPNARTYAKELKGLSYDEKMVYEGFAEFVRHWASDPEFAQAKAPEFYKFWEEFVDNHEYGPALRKAQQGIQDWFNQGALNRLRTKIGYAEELNSSLSTIWDKARQKVLDRFHSIWRMERDLGGESFPVTMGPYQIVRLTASIYSMIDAAFKKGVPVKNENGSFSFTGKGLFQILEGIEDLDQWGWYAYARSAKELKRQGREQLLSSAEIDAGMALETKEFKKAFDEYQTYNNQMLDFVERMGILNKETRSRFRRSQYMPMYRVMSPGPIKNGNGIIGNLKLFKALRGGDQNLNNPILNMMKNTEMLIAEAMRNDARRHIVDYLNAMGGGGKYMTKIPKATVAGTISKGEFRRKTLDMLGLTEADVRAGIVPGDQMRILDALEEAFDEQPDFIRFWMHGQDPKGSNIVAVMRDGKTEFYEVADPELYESISLINPQGKHAIRRFLNATRRIGQLSITLSVDFMEANLLRDTLLASIMSRNGSVPFLESAKGLVSRIKEDDMYWEAMANGVGLSSYFTDEPAFRRHLEHYYTSKGIDYKTVLDTPAKLMYGLETILDAVEMSTRLGEYKKARARGENPRAAAYQAREISTDFAMAGSYEPLGWMFDSIVFLKAGLNGIDRVYRGLTKDENKGTVAMKVAMLAAASQALYIHNSQFSFYNDAPDWDKDSHWHIIVPRRVGADPSNRDDWFWYRYPKLWEVGGIASMAERTAETIKKWGTSEEKGLADLSRDYLRIAKNLFQLEWVPYIAEPLYEQAINENRFTGAPIETPGMESLPPALRTRSSTPKVLRDLGRATLELPTELQVNPVRAEALLRGYFNTWAIYGLTLIDAMAYDDNPTMRVDQYPGIRRLYKSAPDRSSRFENMFYDMLKEATQYRRAVRKMANETRPKEVEVITKNHEEVLDAPQLLRQSRVLNNIRKQIGAVYRATRLTGLPEELKVMLPDEMKSADLPDQKRWLIDYFTSKKLDIMKATVLDIQARQKERQQ